MRNLRLFIVLCESTFKTLRNMTDYVQQGPDMIVCGEGVGCEKITLCSANGLYVLLSFIDAGCLVVICVLFVIAFDAVIFFRKQVLELCNESKAC